MSSLKTTADLTSRSFGIISADLFKILKVRGEKQMKKSITVIVVLAIVTGVLLLLFSVRSQPVDLLIHPPGQDEHNAQIWSVLEKAAGSDYTLKTPTDGEHRSALIYSDINNDLYDEIVAFYSKKGSSDIVNMQLFVPEDNGWKSLAGIESGYNEVKQVEFADLDGDGENEIIVGWGLQKSSILQIVTAYSIDYEKAEIKSLFKARYSSWGVFDFEYDGKSELVVIDSNGSFDSEMQQITIYSQNSGQELAAVAETELSPVVSTVSQLNFDYVRRLSSGRIYIDGFSSDGLMTTDMFAYSPKERTLERCFVDGETVSSLSKRSANIYSADVNNDGMVEIPLQKNIEILNISTSVIEWTDVIDGRMRSVSRYYDNRENGYCFEIPKSIEENSVPVLLSDGSTLRLYSIVQNENEPPELAALFEITIEHDDVGLSLQTQHRFLENHKGKNYCYQIFDLGNELGITKK